MKQDIDHLRAAADSKPIDTGTAVVSRLSLTAVLDELEAVKRDRDAYAASFRMINADEADRIAETLKGQLLKVQHHDGKYTLNEVRGAVRSVLAGSIMAQEMADRALAEPVKISPSTLITVNAASLGDMLDNLRESSGGKSEVIDILRHWFRARMPTTVLEKSGAVGGVFSVVSSLSSQFTTIEEAHARAAERLSGEDKTERLMIVEVKQIAERAPPPIVTRYPTVTDFAPDAKRNAWEKQGRPR